MTTPISYRDHDDTMLRLLLFRFQQQRQKNKPRRTAKQEIMFDVAVGAIRDILEEIRRRNKEAGATSC